jgi:hypothetical protein
VGREPFFRAMVIVSTVAVLLADLALLALSDLYPLGIGFAVLVVVAAGVVIGYMLSGTRGGLAMMIGASIGGVLCALGLALFAAFVDVANEGFLIVGIAILVMVDVVGVAILGSMGMYIGSMLRPIRVGEAPGDDASPVRTEQGIPPLLIGLLFAFGLFVVLKVIGIS